MQGKKFTAPKSYQIISHGLYTCQLGLGSYGNVQLAKCIKTGQIVAIKKIDGKISKNQVQFHMQLNHPNIIKLYDYSFDEVNNNTYVILEYAENGTLFDYIKQNQNKDKDRRIINGIFHSICDAVEYMHLKNIMHRDIKPENILLDRKNVVKLCDFGFAANRQQRKTIGGTAQYMAPQMLAKKPYNYKIDIWALGILYYELIQGKTPFSNLNIQDIAIKIQKTIQFSPKFRQQQINLIKMILRVNPNQRPQIQQIIKSSQLNSNINSHKLISQVSRRSTSDQFTLQQSKIKLIGITNLSKKKSLGSIQIIEIKNLTQRQQSYQTSPFSPQSSMFSNNKNQKFDKTNYFLTSKSRISLKRPSKKYY